MGEEIKNIWNHMHKVVFLVCLAISIVLIIASWFVPPKAQIDSSVLAAVGEIFAFAALATVIEGIDNGHKVTMQKGDVNLTINKDKDEFEHGGKLENELNGER